MLKHLFSSEVRIIILNQFLMHPDNEYYLRQLSSLFKISPRSASLELKNLESIELIQKRIVGNHHFYSVNTQHPLFQDLQNVFLKTVGLKDIIREHLESFQSQIKYGFIYGSLAKGNASAKSDVDLMIIGEISSRKISSVLLQAGTELNREINFSIFSLDELSHRLKNNDHFLTTVNNEPKIFIIGNPNEFERLGKKWLAETT